MAKKKYKAVKITLQESFPTPIALGIQAFAITGSLIFIIQLLRGSAQSETPDKVIYLLAILIAGIFLLVGFSKTS